MSIVSQFSQFRAGLAYTDNETNSGTIATDTTKKLFWDYFVSERNDVFDWFEIYQGTGLSPDYWMENRNLRSGIYAIRMSIEWQDGFAGARHIGCDIGTFASPTALPRSIMGSVGNQELEVGVPYDQYSVVSMMPFAAFEGVARFYPLIEQFNGDTQFVGASWSQFEMYYLGQAGFGGVWHS